VFPEEQLPDDGRAGQAGHHGEVRQDALLRTGEGNGELLASGAHKKTQREKRPFITVSLRIGLLDEANENGELERAPVDRGINFYRLYTRRIEKVNTKTRHSK